jgi:hypothetical protein
MSGSGFKTRKLQLDKQEAFLDAYKRTIMVGRACEEAKINRGLLYVWKDTCPDFLEKFNKCRDSIADTIEDEAKRRAVEGYEKPVYQSGQLVGHIQEYSDQLMNTILKAHKPDDYKDRIKTESTIEITSTTNIDELPLDQLMKLLEDIKKKNSNG